MKVYLVEDCENYLGRILAVFAYKEDAEYLAENLDEAAEVQERNLIYGQAFVKGYNP